MLFDVLVIDITMRHQENHSKISSLLVINLLNATAITALQASTEPLCEGPTGISCLVCTQHFPLALRVIKEHLDSNCSGAPQNPQSYFF